MNWKRVVVLATVVLASAVGGYQIKAHAQQRFPASCYVMVPADWGEYRGMSTGTGVVFEDKDGTIRVVGKLPCGIDREPMTVPQVDVVIKRK